MTGYSTPIQFKRPRKALFDADEPEADDVGIRVSCRLRTRLMDGLVMRWATCIKMPAGLIQLGCTVNSDMLVSA